MNRLSQTILPLALSIGLAGVLELPAIANPRYSHQQFNRSGIVIISPPRHGHNSYQVDSRPSRSIDYGRRNRYDDRYYDYERDYRPRRSSRYDSSDCDRRNPRIGSRNREYYSGQRVIVSPPRYRDSFRNRDYNSNYIRVIRY